MPSSLKASPRASIIAVEVLGTTPRPQASGRAGSTSATSAARPSEESGRDVTARSGMVTGLKLMAGMDTATALASSDARCVPNEAHSFIDAAHAGTAFIGACPSTSYAVIALPTPRQPVEILCIEFHINEPAGPATISNEQNAAA